jgi:hypothetical protein
MSDSTLLELTGITFGDFSCRGLTMDLQPIQSNDGLQRTINGALLDLTALQFRKYAATISCEDQEAPELGDIWQGMPVTVKCIPGVGLSDTGGELTLSMLVDSWTTSRDEWNALTNWTINLLEV